MYRPRMVRTGLRILMNRRNWQFLVLKFVMLTVFASLSSICVAQPAVALDDSTIGDPYVYLLGRAFVVRQEKHDMAEPGAHYNVIKYNPRGSANFVNPNLDVAYLEAWIAVDDQSVAILNVPKISGRYYTAQILDEWGEVIANINERTFPSKPYGKFALVTPGSTAPVPQDAARIMLHSSKAKLLARVELKDDPDRAMALQKEFRLTIQGTPHIAPPPPIADFSNQTLAGIDIFDHADALISSALDVSPVAAQMQQEARYIAHLVKTDPQARAQVERTLRDKVIPAFKEYAVTKSAPYRQHWEGGGTAGNYGADYRLRTTVNFIGIWANVPSEVLYFIATRDAQDKPLDGSHSYVIHFPADRLPQSVVDAYWSVILVSVPDYRVVPNAMNRFNFNSYSPLVKDADGSLRIAIGPKPVPGVPEANWLPSPAGKPFSLTFRAYVPKSIVKRGEWAPPPVTKLN